ncbi:InlB B-repeat-containing protein [Cohnella sp. GCM10012308]|uniref:RCC1 domain-containing protein n=1 Tax=Cohnella sp. GCM10012308 TaxID=3317329 RepID=UPI003618FE01
MRRKTSLLMCLALLFGLIPSYGKGGSAHAAAPEVAPQLVAGYYHTVGLLTDGTVWGWGGNEFGGLADGTQTNRVAPVAATGMSGVASIAAGVRQSFAVKQDGTVWAWGSNNHGQLGDGTTTDRLQPVQIAIDDVASLSGGIGYHTLALKKDGTVWAWGDNESGELGDGTLASRSVPDVVPGLTDIVAVSAGGYHSMALKSDGTVWAWGLNTAGEMGNGTESAAQKTPVQVSGLDHVLAISAGNYHNLALKENGTVWAWGDNGQGRLGDGTATKRILPVQVQGLSGVKAIAAGGFHSVALKEDGTVWGWGHNNYGQVGDGTKTQRNAPVQLSGLSDVVQVSAGSFHAAALRRDGSVWSWGYGGYGQLGNGKGTDSAVPVQGGWLDGTTPDVSPGTISASGVTTDSATLTWSKATDNMSEQSSLQYRVYRSFKNNIQTVADIEAKGIAVNAYTADIDSLQLTGLFDGMPYYFNVIVKDKAGKKTAYTMQQVITVAIPTYSVIYRGNGNTGGKVPVDDYYYYEDEQAEILGNARALIRAGYTFADWNTAADGTGTSYAEGDQATIGQEDLVLYAQWSKNPTFKMLYDGNGETGGTGPSDGEEYEAGEAATVLGNENGFVKKGYTFAGWNTAADGSGTPYAAGAALTMAAADAALYAQWTLNPTYGVTYEAGGADMGSVPVDAGAYEEGAEVTVQDNTGGLVRSGYAFAGWTLSADGGGTVYQSGDKLTMGATDITLHAKWTANPTYGVTYEASGADSGSVPVDAGAYEEGAEVTVQGNTGGLSRSGYTFAGWTLAADGNSMVYQSGDKLTMGAADVTLHAKWTAKPKYSLSYEASNADAGSVPVDAGAYEEGAKLTVQGNTGGLDRSGYTFTGWTLSADGSSTVYQSGDKLTMGAADVTLHAKWTANPTYGVTYGASGADSGSVPVDAGAYEEGAEVTVQGNLGSLTKAGYTFTGWTLAADGTGTVYQSGDKLNMEQANIHLYAKWEIKAGGNPDPDPDPVAAPQLTSLTISTGKWSRAFSSETIEYTITLPADIASIDVTAAAANKRQSVAASVYDAEGVKLGGPVVLGAESKSVALGAAAASLQIEVVAEDGKVLTYKLHIQREKAPDPETPTDPETSTPAPAASGTSEPAAPSFKLTIGGEAQSLLGKATVNRHDLDVQLFSSALNSALAAASEGTTIAITAPDDAASLTVRFDAAALNAMRAKRASLELVTARGRYTLPIADLAIEATDGAAFSLTVGQGKEETALQLSQAASNAGYTVIGSLVAFELSTDESGRTIVIDHFKSFVKRELPLPAGTDPTGVTAIAVEPDGALRPVPTEIVVRDGRYYAVVRSLTNSAYALVRSKAQGFTDISGHWAREAIADMAARLILNGYAGGEFRPNAAVSRAEFAAMLIRALGLPQKESGTTAFTDLQAGAWYRGAVEQAASYGLLRGGSDGRFRPDDTITREEAFAVVMRAAKLAGINASLAGDAERILLAFADGPAIHDWASEDVAGAVQAGLVRGTEGRLDPAGSVTRAETATMLRRMLAQAGLIQQ